MGANVPEALHLFFADDSLKLMGTKEATAETLKYALIINLW